jgi:hypothetical protein
MTLPVATRVGVYEVLSAIGAGGMGEVYLARDTKLNRDVALKVLPESVVHDSDRLARFQREAQVLAFYIKRHIEASAMKGDVLVVDWIGNASKGKAGDWSASQKLLAAVLQKL